MDQDEEGGFLESVSTTRRAALKGLASLVPGASLLVELWAAKVPTRKENREREVVRRLAARLGELGAAIDSSRILSEPYADVFEDVMATVSTRQGFEKATHYVAVLVKGLYPDAPGWDRQERMVATLDALRASHLWVLGMVVRDLREHPVTSASVVGPRRGVVFKLPPGADGDLIDRDWRDMVALGLFEGMESHGLVGPAGQYAAVTYPGGEPLFQATLQPFGLEFAEYVEAEAAVDGDVTTDLSR
jgi:hypothetical protein